MDVEAQVEIAGRLLHRLQHSERRGGEFRADAVAGDDDDVVFALASGVCHAIGVYQRAAQAGRV